MKKEALKAVTVLGLVIALAFITAAASANGTAHSVRANIPFQFMVGNEALPAGEYTVRKLTEDAGAILINSTDGNSAAMRITVAKQGTPSQNKARLVFRKYGESYFLAEVWDGSSQGRALLKSKSERAAEREQSQIARGNALPEIVTVFADVE
jgi:hypothetical protein